MTHPLSRDHVRGAVRVALKEETCGRLCDYVWKQPRPSLWGAVNKDRIFSDKSVDLALYHVIAGIGLNQLAKRTKGWYKVNHKSVAHNIAVIICELGEWGKQQILLGNLQEWEKVARVVEIGGQGCTSRLTLWTSNWRIETV
jgi:hypothetical protein